MNNLQSDKTVSTADSLRLLAAWYDEHPEMAAPSVSVFPYAYGTREETVKKLAAWARALKPVTKNVNDYNVTLTRFFGSLKFYVSVSRGDVCEKIITYKCPESLLASLGEDIAERLETEVDEL